MRGASEPPRSAWKGDHGIVDKLSPTSNDILKDKIARIREEFPHVFSEGRIDFDRLKMALGEFADSGHERYGLTWAGKSEAIRNIQRPSVGTLLPVPEESVNFETSENLIIEGENLEVLKLLQKSYQGKIKMIYIDPPYNTGNEFIYPDNFREGLQDYLRYSGQVDGDGLKLSTNTETDGRFHSKWLTMMYPRLFLARNLLHRDGAMFVSIGSEELSNLIAIMNEIFGEECFKNVIVIRRGVKNVQAQFDTIDALNRGHEYVLFYSRSPQTRFKKLMIPQALDDDAPDSGAVGGWNNHWRGTDRPTMRYALFGMEPSYGQWRWGQERSLKAIENYMRLCAELGENATQEEIDQWVVREESRLGAKVDLLRLSRTGKPEHYVPPSDFKLASDLWIDLKPNGNNQLRRLFPGKKIFDTVKSTDLIERLIEFVCEDDDIVLDFFAGSGTTAHAVLNLNRQEDSHRKFILVQLPEPIDDMAPFKTIADITKERVRRVLAQNGNAETKRIESDKGFKVFRLSSSNFKIWDGLGVSQNEQELATQLALFADNILPGRGKLDVLYEVILKSGLPPTTSVEPWQINGATVFAVAHGEILIYLEDVVSIETIQEMVSRKPRRVVCLDAAFHQNDSLKTRAKLTAESLGIEFMTA